jgi:transposase
MAYREVTMVEVREVLRLWLRRRGNKRIAARLGIDVKTVRRYTRAAARAGLSQEEGEAGLTEEIVGAVMAGRCRAAHRPRGEGWKRCEARREFVARHLERGVRLSKVRKLLRRDGVEVSYATLRRWAMATLDFGRAPTVPLAEGEPGAELQLDTGWVWKLGDGSGREHRRPAWIFTAAVSRHRFVFPVEKETTESAIAACEAAWEVFGGVFRVLIPDNTKTIVQRADPLEPLINATFLEYAQARGFEIDATRSRKPQDKARVERSVQPVRDDCFGGEKLVSLEQARAHARHWCLEEYGMRRHSTTQRLPREHFEAEERSRLLPVPSALYDIPITAEPKVARDHHAQVAKALYSLPTRFIGKRLRARADRSTVRFYDSGVLVKVHPRKAPGERSTDPLDLPEHKRVYAARDTAFLQEQARSHGEAIGRLAHVLLAGALPWTRMRRVYALLRLVKQYGAPRVEEVSRRALDAEMANVERLRRMLELADRGAGSAAASRPPAKPLPARYLRPVAHFARPLDEVSHGG